MKALWIRLLLGSLISAGLFAEAKLGELYKGLDRIEQRCRGPELSTHIGTNNKKVFCDSLLQAERSYIESLSSKEAALADALKKTSSEELQVAFQKYQKAIHDISELEFVDRRTWKSYSDYKALKKKWGDVKVFNYYVLTQAVDAADQLRKNFLEVMEKSSSPTEKTMEPENQETKSEPEQVEKVTCAWLGNAGRRSLWSKSCPSVRGSGPQVCFGLAQCKSETTGEKKVVPISCPTESCSDAQKCFEHKTNSDFAGSTSYDSLLTQQ